MWRDPGPVATETRGCDILAFSFVLGWNPSGDSGPNATRRRAKTFKCSQARWPPPAHPGGTLMDKWGSGSSAATPAVCFCHVCIGIRCICSPAARGPKRRRRPRGPVVRVHHVLSCVPRPLVNKTCPSLPPGHMPNMWKYML